MEVLFDIGKTRLHVELPVEDESELSQVLGITHDGKHYLMVRREQNDDQTNAPVYVLHETGN